MKPACQPVFTPFSGPALAVGVLAVLFSSPLYASSFFLTEQGFDGPLAEPSSAAASNGAATSLFANPAATAQLSSPPGALAITLGGANGSRDGLAGLSPQALFMGAGSDEGHKSINLPELHLARSLGEELWLGFSLSTPYGVETERRESLFAHHEGLDTSLNILSLQPSLAWRINQQWSVGAGMDIQRGEASRSANVQAPGDATERERLQSWQTGFSLGMSYALSEQTRLGWRYHSAMTHRFDGDVMLARPVGGGAELLYSGSSTDLRLPASTSVGFSHRAAPRWTLLGHYTLFKWSGLEESPSQPVEEGVALLPGSDYRDSWTLSLGSEYQFDPQWALRGGVHYSQVPQPGVVGDSTRVALGAAYRTSNRLSVELAYTHVLIRQQSLALDQETSAVSILTEAEGDYRGDSAGDAHLFGLGLRYAF